MEICIFHFSGHLRVEVLFFVIFASGKEQSWNKPDKIDSPSDPEKKIISLRQKRQEETQF